MRNRIKAGVVGLALVAGVLMCAVPAIAKDGARGDFAAQQRADQQAFASTPHNGVQQRTFATRQMMERRTFTRAGSSSSGARQAQNGTTPPGWSHGKKTGWHGGDMPPGLRNR